MDFQKVVSPVFKFIWRKYLMDDKLIKVIGWRSCIMDSKEGQRYKSMFLVGKTGRSRICWPIIH